MAARLAMFRWIIGLCTKQEKGNCDRLITTVKAWMQRVSVYAESEFQPPLLEKDTNSYNVRTSILRKSLTFESV